MQIKEYRADREKGKKQTYKGKGEQPQFLITLYLCTLWLLSLSIHGTPLYLQEPLQSFNNSWTMKPIKYRLEQDIIVVNYHSELTQ